MKKYLLSSFLLVLFAIGFTASNEDEKNSGGGSSPSENVLTGIVKLDSKIGSWDAAYLTKYGYFTYSKDVASETEGNYCSTSYQSTDGTEMATLIATKDENLPTQIVIKDKGIIYFSFPNDSIVEMVYDNGKGVAFLGSFKCKKSSLPGFDSLDKEDVFRAALANAAAIINANTGEETIAAGVKSLVNHFAILFGEVGAMEYQTDADAVSKIPVNSSGEYTFTANILNWYQVEIVVRMYNTISMWTGKATYKVGGSSCTLSGTVWCNSDTYNELGTYGIVCDTDASKLVVGEEGAEYQDVGYQASGDLSYDVDFRGLKPNTTYYYRAYYKFNDNNHGNLIPRYGSVTDQILYDTTIKSFTTGDNILTVDVVMCIDATGSMSGIINTVKNNAMSFYDQFKAKCDDEGIGLIGLNAQVISFRDKNVDGSEWFSSSPTYNLPEQKEAFNSFVNRLYADGGGDLPESGLEALDAAFGKTDWGIDDGYHRQVIILWTDASYLVGSRYTDLTLEGIKTKWDNMPSGRRLILFAPDYSYESNGGNWSNMDSWKNVIHETNLYSGFNSLEYILEAIIGELTSKASARAAVRNSNVIRIVSRPN